jgi:hypothetical protein
MAFNRRKLVAVYNSVGCCRISMNIFSRINHCVTLSTLLIPNRADFWTEIFVIATGEGECNGRLLDRGKLGRVVHSGGDHRRRTVGHRPLMGEWRHCRSHDRFGAWPVVVEGASAETQTDAGPPSSARSVLIWINLLDRTQARAQWPARCCCDPTWGERRSPKPNRSFGSASRGCASTLSYSSAEA